MQVKNILTNFEIPQIAIMCITYTKLFDILSKRLGEKEATELVEYVASIVESVPGDQKTSTIAADALDTMLDHLSRKIDHTRNTIIICLIVSLTVLTFLFRYL